MTDDRRRDVWLPDWDCREVVTLGEEWPEVVIVEKWERNLIGERRYIGSRTYREMRPSAVDTYGAALKSS